MKNSKGWEIRNGSEPPSYGADGGSKITKVLKIYFPEENLFAQGILGTLIYFSFFHL